MEARTCLLLHVNCDVAVTWHIPPPNRSPSFEVSAIFPSQKFDDIYHNARDLRLVTCLAIFTSMSMVTATIVKLLE